MLDQWLAQTNTAAIALADLCLMLLAWRLGFRYARRGIARGSHLPADHAVGVAQSALALLSLLLAFTFGTTYSKYEGRRNDTVVEANAIGTFGTRLLLLPVEIREPALEHLRTYVQLHRRIVNPSLTRADRLVIDRDILTLQDWFVRTITDHLRTPAGASLTFAMMPAMNGMIDEYAERAHGVMAHVPAAVIFLLLVISVASAFLIGRSEGYSVEHQPLVTVCVFVLVTTVLYVSLDLDQPWKGLTRISELPFQRLAESLGVR